MIPRIYLLFFLRNEVVPKEYTSMVISPLHDRVFYLFLTHHPKFHEVNLDNLYMSAKFVHLSYTHQNYVKVQGFCQNGNRVIAREALKTEFHNKKVAD